MKFFLSLLLLVYMAVPTFERKIYLMGTIFYAESENAEQLEEMVRIIEDSEARLSNWKESSEVSLLNKTEIGCSFELSDSLCASMHRLLLWQVSTEGAFDPFIGALTRPGILRAAASDSMWGMNHVELKRCAIVKKAKVLFDSGGFGKGEAIDRILQKAEANHWAPFYLDFGGQIAVWKTSREVFLADPEKREASAISVRITHGSVSTSGNSERPGHLFDPRSGRTVTASYSVAVWRPGAMDADVLSTALYVMGPDYGLQWATKHHIAAAFFRSPALFTATTEFRALIDNDFHFQ